MTEIDTTKAADKQTTEIAERVSERREKAPSVSVEMVDGSANLTIGENSEPEERLKLMAAMGTYDVEFLSPLLSQIGNSVSQNGKIEEDSLQFVVGFIKSIEPQSEIETLLAAQMAATHVAMIRSGRWLANASNIDQMQAHYSGYNKLARTYSMQMETLRKHRNGGKQTVTVQHVNVEGGGQAVVGNVQTGGG